jgi:hypothetical protein
LGKLVSPIICVGQFNHQNHLGTRCKPNSLSTTALLLSVTCFLAGYGSFEPYVEKFNSLLVRAEDRKCRTVV